MTALSIVLDIVLILISLVLIVSVLMQQGQRQGLGAISGGAETFFGKGKAKGLDAKLAKITKIAAVAFIVLAIAATIVVSHNNTTAVTSVDDAVDAVEEAVDEAEDAAEETGEELTEEEPAEESSEEPAEEPAEDAEAIGGADGETDIVVADGADALHPLRFRASKRWRAHPVLT